MNKRSSYKKIEIPVKNLTLPPDDIERIETFFNRFYKGDLFISITNDTITINIHSIEYFSFKDKITAIINNGFFHKDTIEVLKIITDSIENIKSYGLKGSKRVYTGYNDERKVKNRSLKETKRQQYFYAQNNNFTNKNNILPEKYINQIICGDSENVLHEFPDNCIDVIFTSPPYNFGLEYSSPPEADLSSTDNQDDYFWENYFNKLFKILDECIRILKYGGRIIINVQPLFSDYIPSHHIISNFLINKKLIWKTEILWEKNNYNCKYTAWGSWKSPSNPYLKYTWEFLEVFCKGSLKKEGKPENVDITGDEFKKWVYAEWSIAPERNMSLYDHPAMFPEELVVRAL